MSNTTIITTVVDGDDMTPAVLWLGSVVWTLFTFYGIFHFPCDWKLHNTSPSGIVIDAVTPPAVGSRGGVIPWKFFYYCLVHALRAVVIILIWHNDRGDFPNMTYYHSLIGLWCFSTIMIKLSGGHMYLFMDNGLAVFMLILAAICEFALVTLLWIAIPTTLQATTRFTERNELIAAAALEAIMIMIVVLGWCLFEMDRAFYSSTQYDSESTTSDANVPATSRVNNEGKGVRFLGVGGRKNKRNNNAAKASPAELTSIMRK
jgi:hypothetical protein